MADPSTPPAPRASSASRWLWAAGAVVLVVAAGLGTWQVGRSRAQEAETARAAAAATAPARALVSGHDYYLHVKLIEVTDRMPGDKPWDRADGSGPDLRFSLTWHKNVIWNSPEKQNALIGSWDLMKVDLKQIITSGGQADLADLVNAPLVHYAPGETVALKVWDEDPVGSDDVGKLTLKLDDLRIGDNSLSPDPTNAKALKRVIVTVIDRRTPIPELAEMISNR